MAPKQSKDSSVKKLFIIGIVPENHFNVKSMLDKVDIETVEFTVSADVKMCKNYI